MAGEILIADAVEALAPGLTREAAAAAARLCDAVFPRALKALAEPALPADLTLPSSSVTARLLPEDSRYLVTSLTDPGASLPASLVRQLGKSPIDGSLFANPILLWNRDKVVQALVSELDGASFGNLQSQTTSFVGAADKVFGSNELPLAEMRPFPASASSHSLMYGDGRFWFDSRFPLEDLTTKARAIAHEGTHHEQIHLMTMDLADRLGITGSPTSREAALIREELNKRLGNPNPPFPLSDRTSMGSLNVRPQRLLTQSESTRAERLFGSFADLTRSHFTWETAFAKNQAELGWLERDVNTLRGIQSPSLRTSLVDALKQPSSNPSISRLVDLLPKNRKGVTSWRGLDDTSASRIVWDRIRQQHDELRQVESSLLRQNRERPHEVEAYAAEQGVAQAVQQAVRGARKPI